LQLHELGIDVGFVIIHHLKRDILSHVDRAVAGINAQADQRTAGGKEKLAAVQYTHNAGNGRGRSGCDAERRAGCG
jgi:hypothetical protein